MRGSKVESQGWGYWACKEGAIPGPSALLPALSHGVLEKGAGWPDWLARPWGQRERPRPARGAAPRPSPPLPSRPRAGNVLFPPLPPWGQRAGRAGRASYPPLLLPYLLPAQVRAGAAAAAATTAAAAAPDSRRPRAGGALGVGRGEGLGGALRRAGEPAPSGGRALRGRAPPAASDPDPPASPSHPCQAVAPGKVACRSVVGRKPLPTVFPFGRGRLVPTLSEE